MGKKVQTKNNEIETKRKYKKRRQTSSNFMLSSILILMIMMLCGVMFVNKNNEYQIQQIKQQLDETENINTNEVPEEETPDINSCEGTISAIYKGEFNGTVGTHLLIEKQTLNLQEDGTYTKTYENAGGTFGTYYIQNGKIMLTYVPLGAPSTYKLTETLQISNDCSTILISGEGYQYNLIRQ